MVLSSHARFETPPFQTERGGVKISPRPATFKAPLSLKKYFCYVFDSKLIV